MGVYRLENIESVKGRDHYLKWRVFRNDLPTQLIDNQPKQGLELNAQGNVMSVYNHTADMIAMSVSYELIERNIYGSSRVGMNTEKVEMIGAVANNDECYHRLGDKKYECSNHLGNVLAVISDMKIARDDNQDDIIDYFRPTILTSMDYSPFGVLLYERDYTKQVCTTIEIQVEQFIIDESYDSGLDPLNWSTTANTVASIGSGTLNMSKPLGSGLYEITRTVSLEAGVDYTYNFEYAIDGLGNNRGIQCEITDLTTTNVVYTSGYIDVLGNYSTSFTAPTTGNYQVRFFARKANGSTNGFNINHTFSLDNIVLSYIEDQEQTTCDDYDCDYRYAFNGQEKDDEVKNGKGNSYDFGNRMYDSRLGRWLSTDKYGYEFPYQSPYVYVSNSVIGKIDIGGNWDLEIHAYKQRHKFGYAVLILKDNDGNVIKKYRVLVMGYSGLTKDNRKTSGGNTPTGSARIAGWRYGKVSMYGPNRKITFKEPKEELNPAGEDGVQPDTRAGQWSEGEEDRTYIQIHGKGKGKNKRQKLTYTEGCIRMHNADILDLYNRTQVLENEDPTESPGGIEITDDLETFKFDGQTHFIEKEEKKTIDEAWSKVNFISTVIQAALQNNVDDGKFSKLLRTQEEVYDNYKKVAERVVYNSTLVGKRGEYDKTNK